MEQQPIGVFDSGLGGISVLAEALRVLPQEAYLYYGDNGRAPYGVRQPEEVLAFTREAVCKLIAKGCKAIVLACNTATSAAAAVLRQENFVPLIGIEPALKPASEISGEGRVLVMATRLTLTQPKFQALMSQYGRDAVPIPCPELVECVEAGELEGERVSRCLENLLSPYTNQLVKAVVLGCTHFVFLRKNISRIVGEDIPLIDGNHGTVMQLKRVLEQRGLLRAAHGGTMGEATFFTTAADPQKTLEQMERMLRLLL